MSESVFRQFDNDVLHCFELSTAIQLTLPAAKQATLNLSHGDLGLRSINRNAPVAYISPLITSEASDSCSVTSEKYLIAAVNAYNAMVSQPDAKVYLMFSLASTHSPLTTLLASATRHAFPTN